MCSTRNIHWSLLLLLVSATSGLAQEDFEAEPISYSTSQPDNPISRLQDKLDRQEVELTREGNRGYLKSVLQALDIPLESQVLVFSKTSLQLRRISPKTPRAIYFNDDAYIGFCQLGDVLEVSVTDPALGTVFYSLDQHQTEGIPHFERRVDNCLVCHSSSRTEGVPGHLVRSLYVDDEGHPVLSAGSRSVNHTTPFNERWGGWYVTGVHGAQKHLGNLTIDDHANPNQIDNTQGQNVTSLAGRIDTAPYLTPHSDLVALMVLEHQALVHNRITNANYTTKQALAYDTMMNKVLEKPEGNRLESTTRRINNAGEKLLDAILLVGEAPLTEAVQGTSGYAAQFSARGPRDTKGRSLYELDLSRRMFKYPCSYLIYSESFAELPNDVREYVWRRLGEVLSGQDTSEKFAHLSAEDRQAIAEIIRDTVPHVPSNWVAGR